MIDTMNGLPIKPALPEAELIRDTQRPYNGEIRPGDIFAWEPDLPYARELLIVTEISEPPPPLEIRHARGIAHISCGSGLQIWTVPFPDGGREINNDISRFREAVIPTLFKPQQIPLKRVRY